MARSRRKKKLSGKALVLAIIFIMVVLAGYYVYNNYLKDKLNPDDGLETPVVSSGDISFHFMLLGNEKAGDCIYVKAGDNDILIDAGSNSDSIDEIKDYVDDYVTDNKLEYIIITHAHNDHYAGFTELDGSIFDLYECETIIDFPKTNQKSTTLSGGKSQYGYYLDELNDEVQNGAVHYTALECYNQTNGAQRIYNLSDDGSVKLEILYNYYYENKASNENDYSVCVQFHHGERKFIFTGDLESKGEEYLIEHNDLEKVEMYKAAHHGSTSSSSEKFLQVIQPKLVVVPCCAGSIERKTLPENVFPSQQFVNEISKYTNKVYVPSMIEVEYVENSTPSRADDYKNKGEPILLNGNIQVISDVENGVYVECSNNNTLFKDTEWFKSNRQTPSSWLN